MKSRLIKNHMHKLARNITVLLGMADNNNLLLDGTKKDVTSSLQKLNNIINTQSIIDDISVENEGTYHWSINSLVFPCIFCYCLFNLCPYLEKTCFNC